MKAKTDKKIVRSKLTIENGKVETTRNVYNLAKKAKTDEVERNNLQDISDLLRSEWVHANHYIGAR